MTSPKGGGRFYVAALGFTFSLILVFLLALVYAALAAYFKY